MCHNDLNHTSSEWDAIHVETQQSLASNHILFRFQSLQHNIPLVGTIPSLTKCLCVIWTLPLYLHDILEHVIVNSETICDGLNYASSEIFTSMYSPVAMFICTVVLINICSWKRGIFPRAPPSQIKITDRGLLLKESIITIQWSRERAHTMISIGRLE